MILLNLKNIKNKQNNFLKVAILEVDNEINK